ncbi:hypothetical protein C2E23DRAFT_97739 [Lenzites betulinus]|nr:hypothetical protein C2E23DRAFT_97739 [Lenzites betulinus]
MPPASRQEAFKSGLRAKVPRPRGKLRERYATSVLREDLRCFESVKKLIRRILLEELDITRVWTQQDEESKRRLIDRVVTTYPVFAKYEDAWPVSSYCHQHLSELRRTSRRRTANSPATSNLRGASGCTASSSAYNDGADLHTTKKTLVGDRVHPRVASVELPGPTRCPFTRRKDPAVDEAPTPPSGTTTARRLVITQTLTQNDEEVLEFLMSVDKSFGHLLDQFRRAGLTSRHRLLKMMEWSVAARAKFLSKHLLLDPFEQQMLSDGLANLKLGV